MDGSPAAARGGPNPLPAFLVSLLAAAAFFGAARWVGGAPALAIWGGAVWVFVLSTIITLPLLAALPVRLPKALARGNGTTMVLALVVWLCTLPFVFLLVMPALGFRPALGVALALLLGITLVCWALCSVGRTRTGTAP